MLAVFAIWITLWLSYGYGTWAADHYDLMEPEAFTSPEAFFYPALVFIHPFFDILYLPLPFLVTYSLWAMNFTAISWDLTLGSMVWMVLGLSLWEGADSLPSNLEYVLVAGGWLILTGYLGIRFWNIRIARRKAANSWGSLVLDEDPQPPDLP